MIEEDIHNWYEEKREEQLKDYMKRMDKLLLDEEKKPLEETKKLMLENEKEFLEESAELRKKYEDMISAARKKEVRTERRKQLLEKQMNPLNTAWGNAKEEVYAKRKELSSRMYRVRMFFLTSRGDLKRKYERIKLWLADAFHPVRLFHEQHIWPILHFLNSPFRMLMKLLSKYFAIGKAYYKKYLAKTVAISKKTLKFAGEKNKLVFGSIGNAFGKIQSKIKEITSFFRRLSEYIKAKYFPETK